MPLAAISLGSVAAFTTSSASVDHRNCLPAFGIVLLDIIFADLGIFPLSAADR